MKAIEGILDQFEQRFEREAVWMASAPGRVNLIGEHTDYNGGFVLPAAIDRRVAMAAARRDDSNLELYSVQFDQSCSVNLAEELSARDEAPWANYIIAVADQFTQRGVKITGLDMAISGDVPLGAGLSSSAAIEVAAAWLFSNIADAGLSKREAALLAQAAEHSKFVGVKCGIMDQFASALGEIDAALLIDCHSLDVEIVPFDGDLASILIINSMKKRGLVESEYNRRRQECEEGLRLMGQLAGHEFPTIRHIPMDVFKRHENSLPDAPRRRLRHNLSENARVLKFVERLRECDMIAAGRLITESHESLRDDFNVSTPELDAIVEMALGAPGVFGCRLTGAGFGGCCVALASPEQAAAAAQLIRAAFHDRFGVSPEVYTSAPEGGVEFGLN